MNENVLDQPSSKYSQGFSRSSPATTDPYAFTASEFTKLMVHLIPCRIKTYRTILNRIILISSSNSSKKTQKIF